MTPPVAAIHETVQLLASLALSNGFSTRIHPVGPIYAPATFDEPGAAGFYVEVKPRLKTGTLGADLEDRRWDAAIEALDTMITTTDPKGRAIRAAFKKDPLHLTFDCEGGRQDTFLRDLAQESARFHLEAANRLEALMVEAGIARRRAERLIRPLIRPKAAPHEEVRLAMELLCAIAVSHGFPTRKVFSGGEPVPATPDDPGVGGVYLDISSENPIVTIEAGSCATDPDRRWPIAEDIVNAVVAAVDASNADLRRAFEQDATRVPTAFRAFSESLVYSVCLQDAAEESGYRLIEAPEALEELMADLGIRGGASRVERLTRDPADGTFNRWRRAMAGFFGKFHFGN